MATAVDGQDCLERVTEIDPDVITLDVMMPRLDGWVTAGQLRRNPQTSRIRVVLITARAQEDDKSRGREIGVDAYLTKPFDPAEMIRIVRDLARRRPEEQFGGSGRPRAWPRLIPAAQGLIPGPPEAAPSPGGSDSLHGVITGTWMRHSPRSSGPPPPPANPASGQPSIGQPSTGQPSTAGTWRPALPGASGGPGTTPPRSRSCWRGMPRPGRGTRSCPPVAGAAPAPCRPDPPRESARPGPQDLVRRLAASLAGTAEISQATVPMAAT